MFNSSSVCKSFFVYSVIPFSQSLVVSFFFLFVVQANICNLNTKPPYCTYCRITTMEFSGALFVHISFLLSTILYWEKTGKFKAYSSPASQFSCLHPDDPLTEKKEAYPFTRLQFLMVTYCWISWCKTGKAYFIKLKFLVSWWFIQSWQRSKSK